MRGHHLVITLLLMSSCSYQTDTLNKEDYVEWFADNDELIKEKRSKYVELGVRYLPPGYLMLKDIENEGGYFTHAEQDSIEKQYSEALYFEIEVSAINPLASNLLQFGLKDYEEYKTRINYLNFHIDDFVKLTMDGREFSPILAHMESFSELSSRLIFRVAFAQVKARELTKNEIRLTFEDPCWRSGTNHFSFSLEHLNNLPKLALMQ